MELFLEMSSVEPMLFLAVFIVQQQHQQCLLLTKMTPKECNKIPWADLRYQPTVRLASRQLT